MKRIIFYLIFIFWFFFSIYFFIFKEIEFDDLKKLEWSNYYYKHWNNIYYSSNIVFWIYSSPSFTKLDVDYKTFTVLNNNYSKDKKNILYCDFWGCNILEWVDNKSFTVLDNYYSKDKDNIIFCNYWGCNILEWIDYKSFTVLNKWWYAKDKYNNFKNWKIVLNDEKQ